MGVFRYFMAPAGLIQLDELPRAWGLIEVTARGAPIVRCGHVFEKPQQELNYRKDYSAWQHENNIERETALLVRLFERVGDAESLHRTLKILHNQASQSQATIERLQAELKLSLKEYWALRQQFESITGMEPASLKHDNDLIT